MSVLLLVLLSTDSVVKKKNLISSGDVLREAKYPTNQTKLNRISKLRKLTRNQPHHHNIYVHTYHIRKVKGRKEQEWDYHSQSFFQDFKCDQIDFEVLHGF